MWLFSSLQNLFPEFIEQNLNHPPSKCLILISKWGKALVIDGLRNSNLEKMRNFTEKQLCERLFLIKLQALTLIWVGFLGLRFEMGGGEVELPPSEFCPISADWGELGIPNLGRMSLIKCCWMLQNSRVTAFTVSELLRSFFIEHLRTRASEKNSKLEILRDSLFINLLK